MDSTENKSEPVSGNPPEAEVSQQPREPQSDSSGETTAPYDEYGYALEEPYEAPAAAPAALVPAAKAPAAPPPPRGPVSGDDEDDDDDEGMLRMSFLEHLEELRSRILKALLGIGVAFALSLVFTSELWLIIQAPAEAALKSLKVEPARLVVTNPTEAFSIIWVKLPVLTAIFLSSPWILYQVWGFIAPGLYKKERRWAVPFILCSAGLFISGGLFGYFVAFRFGLAFLLGIAVGNNITTMVTITEYFDTFVNVTLALGLVFELPVLIFFLALLRVVTPQFLIRNSRYAILIIVVIAAVVTPTPDVINLMMIAVPMALLYFAGVFASYLLWLSRENKRFPWALMLLILLTVGGLVAATVWVAVNHYGYRVVQQWPFLVR